MNNSPFRRSKGAIAYNKYNIARANLLLTVIFTVVNVVLTAANANAYLLFSASMPHIIASMCATAVHAPEVFADLGIEISNPGTVLIVGVTIALILTVPYFLCWVFSKKRYGWMIAALVFFSIDTLFLIPSFFIYKGMILDILFHAYVMYYLIMGVANGARVRKAEAEASGKPAGEDAYIVSEGTAGQTTDGMGSYTAEFTAETAPIEEPDTLPLRSAAMSEMNGEKVKVYAEYTTPDGHRVQYRRVGKQEELVVDGQVYAEMPRPRVNGASMTARVNGVVYEAGIYSSRNIITVNGNIAATTTRWI